MSCDSLRTIAARRACLHGANRSVPAHELLRSRVPAHEHVLRSRTPYNRHGHRHGHDRHLGHRHGQIQISAAEPEEPAACNATSAAQTPFPRRVHAPSLAQLDCLRCSAPPRSPFRFTLVGECTLIASRRDQMPVDPLSSFLAFRMASGWAPANATRLTFDLCRILATVDLMRNGRAALLWDGLSPANNDTATVDPLTEYFVTAGALLANSSRPPPWAGAPANSSFASCAVVGGAPSLMQRADGAEIDGHERVFRFNDHPIGGAFEPHVGRRDGVRIVRTSSFAGRSRHRAHADDLVQVVCMHMYMHMCMDMCMYMLLWLYMCTCASLAALVQVVCMCIQLCMCICMCICTCVPWHVHVQVVAHLPTRASHLHLDCISVVSRQVVAHLPSRAHKAPDVLRSYVAHATELVAAGERVSLHATAPDFITTYSRLYAQAHTATTGLLGVFLAMGLCRTPPRLYGFTTLRATLNASPGLAHYHARRDATFPRQLKENNAAWLFVHECLGLVDVGGGEGVRHGRDRAQAGASAAVRSTARPAAAAWAAAATAAAVALVVMRTCRQRAWRCVGLRVE